MPARYVFVLTDANTRIGKIGERGGEEGSNVMGAYDRDVPNNNGKLLLDILFCILKSGVSYRFKSTSRSKGQAFLD